METQSSLRAVIVLLRTPQPLTGGTGSRQVAREKVSHVYILTPHTHFSSNNQFILSRCTWRREEQQEGGRQRREGGERERGEEKEREERREREEGERGKRERREEGEGEIDEVKW